MNKHTLSLRPKGQLKGFATVLYDPERNDALLRREERTAQEWCAFIDQIDFTQFSLTHEVKDDLRFTLEELAQAYREGDVPDAQIACQHIAKTLIGDLQGNFPHRKELEAIARYRNQYHYWAVANVELELARYYRWWVDRELVNITMVPGFGLKGPNKWPHITLTRGLWEMSKIPKDLRHELWGSYEGERVEFTYTPDIKPYNAHHTEPGTHWALDVQSPKLARIRADLGLSANYHFHLTVGRTYDRP